MTHLLCTISGTNQCGARKPDDAMETIRMDTLVAKEKCDARDADAELARKNDDDTFTGTREQIQAILRDDGLLLDRYTQAAVNRAIRAISTLPR
jgi:hypothetical protein